MKEKMVHYFYSITRAKWFAAKWWHTPLHRCMATPFHDLSVVIVCRFWWWPMVAHCTVKGINKIVPFLLIVSRSILGMLHGRDRMCDVCLCAVHCSQCMASAFNHTLWIILYIDHQYMVWQRRCCVRRWIRNENVGDGKGIINLVKKFV